jgi:hypothetical protein
VHRCSHDVGSTGEQPQTHSNLRVIVENDMHKQWGGHEKEHKGEKNHGASELAKVVLALCIQW